MASHGQHPAIARTSPPRPGLSGVPHPRRTAAHKSVSLRHSPSKKNSASSSDDALSTLAHSPSSLRPVIGRGSSGESSSNADKWFEQSNNAVRDNSTAFGDNDPPFFMRNSSSSETPPDRQPAFTEASRDDRANSLPLRTGLLELGRRDSTEGDFRSVIDDLTVENKKLKRRLKKYEKLHDAHLKDDKLFEVRIHGLPLEKKRELEETLQKFASSLHTAEANAFPSNGYASLAPMTKRNKTATSSISMQNTDSAYASMSASGQGSVGIPGTDLNQRMTPAAHLASSQQKIQNYLHDIPQGLLPQHSQTTLSERAKKKLVVRRLEQIFAGKGAAQGGHQHSLQQEEVSQSAAQADRTEIEATGQRAMLEGKREASIMENETEDPLVPQTAEAVGFKEGTTDPIPIPLMQMRATTRSPARHQRPTRPLDLDPQRAQVPYDNIRYMTRLGFSPPDLRQHESHEDGHGWIYLNFLINMAQLHTINVTSDFVRKALDEFSHKFEISNDGRKVRWRGGQSVTRASSDNGGRSSSTDRAGEDTPEGQSPRKRVKLSHPDGAQSLHADGRSTAALRRRQQINKHAYTPLFFHRDSTDETDSSSSEAEEEDSSSPWPGPVVADHSTAVTSFDVPTTTGMTFPPSQRKPKLDNGPIIFYNNARFCTDLSGDKNAGFNQSAPAYKAASEVPIGNPRKLSGPPSERRGPLAQASELPEPMDLGDNPIPESMELSFPQRSPVESSSGEESDVIELEVTGIGGVWPADNFAISVNSRHARVDELEVPRAGKDVKANTLPPRLAKILRVSDSKPTPHTIVQKQVITSKLRELPPSALPEALSFMQFDDDDSTSSSSASDVEDSLSDTASSTSDAPSAAPQPVGLPWASDHDDTESEYEESADSEVDFLATARALNPEAVRQQEREYDADMAERLADHIPAG